MLNENIELENSRDARMQLIEDKKKNRVTYNKADMDANAIDKIDIDIFLLSLSQSSMHKI